MTISNVLFPVAGKGRRLGAIGRKTPKCLLRVGGEPLLAYLLRIFRRARVTRACLVVKHQAARIPACFGDSYAGLALSYVHDVGGGGSAYALRNAAPLLRGEPFFMCDGDILFHPSLPVALRDRMATSTADGVLTFGRPPAIAPTHKSALAFQHALRTTARQLQVPVAEYVLMGVNVLGDAILDALAGLPRIPSREVSTSDLLLATMDERSYVWAFYDGPWWHLAYARDFATLLKLIDELELPAS